MRGEIGRSFEPRAEIRPCRRIADEKVQCIEAALNGLRVSEGCGKSRCNEARAGGCHGAVDGLKERSTPLAGQCAHELEIAARGLIISSVVPCVSRTGGDSGGRSPSCVRST